jgi:hypothetical protein
MKLAFTQAVQKTQGDNIYLVHGGEDHTKQSAWYFIRVDSPKIRAFLKAISAGSIDLENFGTILESGYGKEPPHSVLEKMRNEYGYKG